MLVGMLQRTQNIQPDESKLESITRTIAMLRVPALVKQLTEAGERSDDF